MPAFINGPMLLVALGIVAGALIVMAIILAAIWRRQTDADKLLDTLRDQVTGLKSDQRFYLTSKNLGPLHEKINDVGKDVAGISTAVNGLQEQLRVINRHLMERK